MKKDLKDLEAGDRVLCTGNSSFCHDHEDAVKSVQWRYDEYTGEKYKVLVLSGGRQFNSRTGRAINPPLAYNVVSLTEEDT